MAEAPVASPFDQLAGEMRETLKAVGDPTVRTCAIVVELAGSGKVIVCSSDSRQWVAQALLAEGIDHIKQARRGT
jgi:hypothetical protein